MDWESELHPFLTSPTVDSLGISDELKDKLEDVLIPEQQFTLGRMLGKGVWSMQGWQEFAFSDGFGCSCHFEGMDLGQLL